MDLEDEVQRVNCWVNQIGNFGLRLLWRFIHLLVRFWYLGVGVANVIESYLISSGLLKRYKAIDVGKLRYLAIVVDSEDACQISKVIQLLQWLEAIGVKHLCLYDTEGVLKKSKESILVQLKNAISFEEADEKKLLLDQKHMTLEFASISDGKEAVAKGGNELFMKYLKLANTDAEQKEQIFTEANMGEALRAVGCGGPDPDLLLVYGPARCHLGFPAWRIRYTEIVSSPAEVCFSWIKLWPIVLQTYGTLEVHEIRFSSKGHLQVHHGVSELRNMSLLLREVVVLNNRLEKWVPVFVHTPCNRVLPD